MPENQNIEWKESWRDNYLKWICGFANSQGGKEKDKSEAAKWLQCACCKMN